MAPVDDNPRGGTALIVVPGVGDDASGDTVASMTRALLVALGPGAHSTPLTRTIVVPPLPGSGDDAVVHDVCCAQIHLAEAAPALVVYEMHWADLSRFPGTLRRFVLTLYGVLFQLSTIGIEAFRAIPSPRWPQHAIRLFSYLTAVLVVGLTAGAAILGIEFAAMVRLTSDWQQLAIAGLTLLLSTALVWLGDRFLRGNGWRFTRGFPTLGPPWCTLSIIAAGVGVTPLILHARGTSLSIAVHEVLWFGVRWVLPGAWGLIGVVAVAISLTMLWVMPCANDDDVVDADRLRANRTAVLSVVVGGLGIALLGALLVAAGLAATAGVAGAGTTVPFRAARDVEARDRTFGSYAESVFEHSLRPLGVALLCALALILVVVVMGFRYGSAMVQASGSGGEPPRLRWALLAAAGTLAVVAVLLSRRNPSAAADSFAVGIALVALALAGGCWIRWFRPNTRLQPFRRGFDVLLGYLGSVAHVLALIVALLVAAGALAIATPLTPGAGEWMGGLSQTLFAPLTALVSGSALDDSVEISATVAVVIALAALVKARLVAVANGLDVAYDVATYLRVPHGTPTDPAPVEPPRRRVLRRYATLLDHIREVQGPERIVIAAHSQGSVYSMALLFGDEFRDRADRQGGNTWPLAPRLLPGRDAPGPVGANRERPPTLSAPLALITAGCPIRQTYAPNFPGQYDWTSDTAAVASMLAAIGPATTWRNVYRSGDYLGRALWAGAAPICTPPAPPSPLEEFCLGPGHHTGYWSDPRFAAHVLAVITGGPQLPPGAGAP